MVRLHDPTTAFPDLRRLSGSKEDWIPLSPFTVLNILIIPLHLFSYLGVI